MSLVALKRKTRRWKVPISGRTNGGFSLNGGYRNQGWIGQTTSSRSNCSLNNPAIIKRSTMNTSGLIDATVTYPTGAILQSTSSCNASCKKNWVKDTSVFITSAAEHTRNISLRASSKNIPWQNGQPVKNKPGCHSGCDAASFWIGGKHYIREPYAKGPGLYATSSSEYQSGGLMRKKSLPTPPCLKHFPFTLNYSSSNQYINFNTPDQAIARGALPSDWMNCNQYPNCCKPTPK